MRMHGNVEIRNYGTHKDNRAMAYDKVRKTTGVHLCPQDADFSTQGDLIEQYFSEWTESRLMTRGRLVGVRIEWSLKEK